MNFKDILLNKWWNTCTDLEKKTLLMFMVSEDSTPSAVLDKLSSIAICNFAVDRLCSAIDAEIIRLRKIEYLLSALTLEEIGTLNDTQ